MRVRSRRPAHRVTTAQLRSAFPFTAGVGWSHGLHLGTDLGAGGTAFRYDPWELYAEGQLTNPNMLVIGQVGRGKSAAVKAYCARSLAVGRRVIALDRKGELDRLCEAAGTSPIRLERGGRARLNPLDARMSAGAGLDAADIRRDRLELLVALGGAGRRRALTAVETTALGIALDRAVVEVGGAQPTLRDVVSALLTPRRVDAAPLGLEVAALAHDSREVALELRRLVDGDLAGMVDGQTAGIDLDHRLVAFDLSGVAASEASLAALLVCVTAWAQRLLVRQASQSRRAILVLEEAWACLRHLEVARWLRSMQKLSRQHGLQVVLVLHRLSDLAATGNEGSEVLAVTRGLLADTETHVVFGMPAAEVAATRELLGLNETEAALLPELPRGRALWRIAGRSTVVDLHLSTLERWICDTDAQMRPAEASR